MGCGVSKTQPVLAPVAADTASEEKPEVDTEKAAEVEPKQEAGAGESIEEKEAWLTDWMENEQDDDGSREAAALKIQALQRGRKGRDEVSELRARLAEMEQRAEVYRGVVRAAEASYEKVQEKVAEDLRRLDEDRCSPVDAEYERAMEDYERVVKEVEQDIHVAELMLDEALRKVEDEEAKANENLKKGQAAMSIAQTQNEKDAANSVIDDAKQHLDEAAYLSKRARLDEEETKKKAEERLALVRTRGEAVIQRKKFSDGARTAGKRKAEHELKAALKRVTDAKGVVEHVEKEIRETMDKEYANKLRITEAEQEARRMITSEDDLSKFERDTAELAKSPEIQRLAQETSYSNEYLASLQMTMKARQALAGNKRKEEGSKSGDNFLSYLEEASVFRENSPLKDRVEYLFKMFDQDNDGKLGRQDLQNVIGAHCTPEMVDQVLMDMGGIKARYVTLQNLIDYAESSPGVAEALTMRAKNSGGLASQLTGKPLVLMALKHGAACDDDDESNDEFEGFVRCLAAMAPGKPLRAKLELVWDALDLDQSGTLDDEEVARIARECQGAEADKVIMQLRILRDSIPGTASVAYQGIPKDDFMRFAMYKLPGIEQALTVYAAGQIGQV